MTVGRRPLGPAYANLQGRKPREIEQGGASEAMGISAPAVCCRRALTGYLGSGRGGIQVLLGHAKLDTTALYSRGATKAGVAEADRASIVHPAATIRAMLENTLSGCAIAVGLLLPNDH